jgi:microcystin-dependent protein
MPVPPLPGQNFFSFQNSVPVGSVIAFAGKIISPQTDQSPPSDYYSQIEAWGWMSCDGRELKISEYPELFQVLGYLYSKNQSGDTFLLPDFRGYFIRGVDDGSGNDPDASTRKLVDGSTNSGVGSEQEDALQVHEHDYDKISAKGSGTVLSAGQGKITTVGSALTGDPTNADPQDPAAENTVKTSQKETRAKNYAVNYIIKYAYLNSKVS